MSGGGIEAYLAECRGLVETEVRRFVPRDSPFGAVLYNLMLDYPLREGKGLRPALCIATCRALGGTLEGALTTAAVLELYHNAFLIHDDVEDGSLERRRLPTLHRQHGVPVAINVGDGMLALALEPLLDNARLVGLGRALRVLRAIARMARESAEGQALELDLVRRGAYSPDDATYLQIVEKKTAFYSFTTPVTVGAILAGADAQRIDGLAAFAQVLGVAFQIQDDLLNLIATAEGYGKELAGDLWEGKQTLMLAHALRSATTEERRRALEVLALPRPLPAESRATHALGPLLDELTRSGNLSGAGRRRVEAQLQRRQFKDEAGVRYLLHLIDRYGSIDHATRIARRHGEEALALLRRCELPPSSHHEFLLQLTDYVLERRR